jgi:hypothetical protein
MCAEKPCCWSDAPNCDPGSAHEACRRDGHIACLHRIGVIQIDDGGMIPPKGAPTPHPAARCES